MSSSLNKSDRERAELKQLRASCYPANLKRIYPNIQDDMLDALDRLFDPDSAPQLEDYKAVLRGVPLGCPGLSTWLKTRMSERQWNSWILEAARVFVAVEAERKADAEFRAKQISNRSGESNQRVTSLRAFANSIMDRPLVPELPEASASAIPTTAPEPAQPLTPLELDRERERLTGKVSAALLCADYDISAAHLGTFLRRWHLGGDGHESEEISTSRARQLTRADVETVRERLAMWKQEKGAKGSK